MKKSLILSNLKVSGSLQRQMAVTVLTDKLLHTMTEHIGRENSLTSDELFKMLFGIKKVNIEDNPQHWFIWQHIKKAMHRCRQRTKCFIVSLPTDTKYKWEHFVIRTEEEALLYGQHLEKCMRRMEAMQKRALKAANEKWYLETWTEEIEEEEQEILEFKNDEPKKKGIVQRILRK